VCSATEAELSRWRLFADRWSIARFLRRFLSLAGYSFPSKENWYDGTRGHIKGSMANGFKSTGNRSRVGSEREEDVIVMRKNIVEKLSQSITAG
jgi:hypothetical protein